MINFAVTALNNGEQSVAIRNLKSIVSVKNLDKVAFLATRFLVFWAVLFSLAGEGNAATPAGTRIINQASASFEWMGREYKVNSNMVYNRVAPIYNFEILPNGTVENPGLTAYGSPGSTIYFPYTLFNTGNVVASYDLSAIFLAEHSDFEPFMRYLRLDINSDGRLDVGESEVAAGILRNVAPGSKVDFLLVVEIPATARDGQRVHFDIRGDSRESDMFDYENVSRIIISQDGFLTLRKQANPGRVLPGGQIDYRLDVVNPSGIDIGGVDVIVDGIVRNGVFIQDPIPEWESRGTMYKPGSIKAAPQGLALVSTDGGETWRSTNGMADEPSPDLITDVGYLWENGYRSGQSGRLEFSVIVDVDRQVGRIGNRGELRFSNRKGEELRDESSNTVFVEVASTADAVYIGPLGNPRAMGPNNTNDDFTFDPGISPDASTPFQVAGNSVIFYNTIENAGNAVDTINISIDKTAEELLQEMGQQFSVLDDSGQRVPLPVSTIPPEWGFQLLQSDGVSTLFDTNGDGIPDTGPLQPGQTYTIAVKVTIPPNWIQEYLPSQGWQAVVRATSVAHPGSFNLTINRVPSVRGLFQFWDNFEKLQDAPEVLNPGDEIRYTNRFGHTGDMVVTNAVIVDTLSDKLTNISNITTGLIQNLRGPEQIVVEGKYHEENHEIIWTLPLIPQDFLGEISFTAEVAPWVANGDEIANEFTITSEQIQAVRSSNEVTVVVGGNAVIDIQKSANRNDAELGDPVQYQIEATNQGVDTLTDVELLDILPRGFRYIEGTATINGEAVEPEISEDGSRLLWLLEDMTPNRTYDIVYASLVTADAWEGDGVNTAIISVTFPGGTRFSTDANHRMLIREGIFEKRSLVFGRVYVDLNNNREHDMGEPGISGVRLYLDDGTTVLTDRNGMYHIEGVHPGSRVIRLDETTLPAGYNLGIVDSANAGNPSSRFMDLRWGTPHKANFRVVPHNGIASSDKENLSTLSLVEWDPEKGFLELQTDLATPVSTWYEESTHTLHLTYHHTLAEQRQSHDHFGDVDYPIESFHLIEDRKNSIVAARIRLSESWGALIDSQWQLEPRAFRLRLNPESSEESESVDHAEPADAADPAAHKEQPEEAPAPASGPVIEYPLDGEAFIARSRISVGTTAHLAAEFELRINGEVVSLDQLGTRSYRVRERRSFYEFVGLPLVPGENLIEWQTTEPGRGMQTAQVRVFRSADPKTIEVKTLPERLLADGITPANIQIRLLDENNIPTGEASVITVKVDRGDIISRDFRPNEPGHQIQIRDGVAMLQMAAMDQPTTVNLQIEAGRMVAQEPLRFQPHLRDWIMVGSADGTASFNRNRETGELDDFRNDDWSGRVAAFVKGKLPRDILLTASYDSARRWQDNDLFRQYEPERYYPVFGDGSEPTYEAASRDQYYVKLEKDQSHVMYGDIWTELRETELGAYNRSLTGAKADITTDWLDIKAFAAEDDQRQIRFEVQGQGISGYYKLPNSNILINSDEILLQVRDRDRPDMVLSEQRLARHSDYSIDYYLGRVLFKKPIPSADENFNPIVLVFRYEVENERGGEFLTYGGRVAVHDPQRRVEVGGTYVIEENEDVDHRLRGVDSKIELGAGLSVVGEYMETRDAEDLQDQAMLAELKGTYEKAEFRVYYQDVGELFNNPNTRGNLGGRETYGVDAITRPSERWETKTQAYRQKMSTFNSVEDVFVQDFIYKTPRAEYLFGGGYVSESTPSRDPDADGAMEDLENPFVKAGIGMRLTEKIRTQLLHQQSLSTDVTRDQSTRTSVDILYQMLEHTALSLTLERRQMFDGYQESLMFGSESQYLHWLSGSHKYALDGHTSGRRGRAINGLQADYPVNDRLSLLASAEVSTLLNEAVTSENVATAGDDFWATALGFRYTEANEYTLNGRVEVRVDDRSDDYFKELGGTKRFGINHTFFARNRVHLSRLKEQEQDRWRVQFLTGWAYRPVLNDRLNYITDLRIEYEEGGSTSGFGKLNKFVWSNDLHYQFSDRFRTEWRYAAKLVHADFAGGSFFSDVLATRWSYDFTERFFGAAGMRAHRDHHVRTNKLGYGVELGFRPVRDFIIAVGYNFEGLKDRDFARGDHWEKGMYIAFRFKFDESILGILNRLERTNRNGN